MIATVLIAIAAGAASALMFASIISGALISLLLFYLAPLPLMVAALGWGPLAASIGGIAAAVGLGAIFSLPYCIAFAVTVALPAWWLGHLALLGRPVAAVAGNGAAQPAADVEWYPIGRILLWVAGFAVLTTMAVLLTLGTDADTINSTLRRGLLEILKRADAGSSGDLERVVDAIVAVAPVAAAIMATLTLTLNLWLATKITQTSGRLQRPWPDLKSTALPPMTLVALCVAIAFCFVGGLVGMAARTVTTALLIDYTFIGLAVLHTLTLSLNGRAFWLCGAYAAIFLFGWPVLVIAALGLADAMFGFRERYMRGRPPPLPAS
jgi:Predicted membrane protein (DUF2232)